MFIFVLFSSQFNCKLTNVVALGDRTRGRRIVGADGSSELWQLSGHFSFLSVSSKIHHNFVAVATHELSLEGQRKTERPWVRFPETTANCCNSNTSWICKSNYLESVHKMPKKSSACRGHLITGRNFIGTNALWPDWVIFEKFWWHIFS